MAEFPDILIIRHGETLWNRAGIMQGQMDSPLSDKGVAQAKHLNALLRGAGLTADHRAWVSPLGRTIATAQHALRGHFDSWTLDERLMEIDVGDVSGVRFEDALAGHPELADIPGQIGWQFHAPGGESYDAFAGRICSWLEALQSPAVVVTHGITSRVMRALILGKSQTELDDLPGGQGIIHRIRNGVAEILE